MIVIFIIGVALLFVGLYPAGQILYFSPYGKAKIEKINVSVVQRQESRLYIFVDVFWVDVLYIYTINGLEYSSKRVGVSDGLKFQNRSKAEKFAHNIRGIKECFYSMKHPDYAHLTYSISKGDGDSTYSLIVSGFLLVAIYLFLFFYM